MQTCKETLKCTEKEQKMWKNLEVQLRQKETKRQMMNNQQEKLSLPSLSTRRWLELHSMTKS